MAGEQGTGDQGARDASSWAEWVDPAAAVTGGAVSGAAVAGAAGIAAAVAAAAAALGDGLPDDVASALDGAGPAGADENEDLDELMAEQTQSVADHGVTLMNMDGMAQAQADMIESFNPDAY